jgi:hypothetical protein
MVSDGQVSKQGIVPARRNLSSLELKIRIRFWEQQEIQQRADSVGRKCLLLNLYLVEALYLREVNERMTDKKNKNKP